MAFYLMKVFASNKRLIILLLVLIGVIIALLRNAFYPSESIARAATSVVTGQMVIVGSGDTNVLGAFMIVDLDPETESALYVAYSNVLFNENGRLEYGSIVTGVSYSSTSTLKIGNRSQFLYAEKGHPDIRLGSCVLEWSYPTYIYPYNARSINDDILWLLSTRSRDLDSMTISSLTELKNSTDIFAIGVNPKELIPQYASVWPTGDTFPFGSMSDPEIDVRVALEVMSNAKSTDQERMEAASIVAANSSSQLLEVAVAEMLATANDPSAFAQALDACLLIFHQLHGGEKLMLPAGIVAIDENYDSESTRDDIVNAWREQVALLRSSQSE